MKKLLVTASALIAFAGFGTGIAQAHEMDPADAEDAVAAMFDRGIEIGAFADYEITDSESDGPHKVAVSAEVEMPDGDECSGDVIVKFKSARSNRVSMRMDDVECI